MAGKNVLANHSAARIVATIFGVLGGIGGLTHGIGETLQGNVPTSGIFIPSWTQGPIATSMDGDPAITLIPNVLITGIAALVVSLAIIVWSLAFVQRKRGGLVLILLNIILLLVGGGVGPIVIGVLAGVAGTGIDAPYPRWRARLSDAMRRFMAGVWPWIFGICLIISLFLFIGAILLITFVDIRNSDLFLNSFYLSALTLLLTVITGIAYDIQNRDRVAIG